MSLFKRSLRWSAAVLLTASFNSLAGTTLINNISGYTLNKKGELIAFSSVLIENGKVKKLDPESPRADAVVDGHNNVLLPGLIDAHGHLLGLGSSLLEVDVRESKSAQDAAKLAAAYAFANPEQRWITGSGWNQEMWPDRSFPDAGILDKAIPRRPVWLTRVDAHAGWANSAALKLAGITRDTPDPVGGKIMRDADGNPSGVLIDNAMGLMEKVMPAPGAELYHQQLNAAGQHLLSVGITAMHDAGVPHQVYDFYLARAAEQSLPVRIYAMVSATDKDLDAMLDNGPVRSSDDFLFIRSVKAYGDGALGSRGAALLAPYTDDPHQTGLLLTQPEEMAPLFSKVMNAGFQLNFHAIGDRANRMALDQFEKEMKKHPDADFRNRIEHAQVIHPDDLPRFAELGVLPSMQPTHATSDKNMAEDRLGKDRMAGAYAWKTLLDSGIPIPLGSDFPVELANPFYGIHAAVTRQDRNNQPVKGWYAHEAMTVQQAFRGFTLDAAYAAHMEDSLGTLTPGKWADFILVDQDIFDVDPKDIWRTRVLQTWTAGIKVFAAERNQ